MFVNVVKKYKHRQSLNSHKKKCTFSETTIIEVKEKIQDNNEMMEMMEMMKKLMTENEKLTELVKKDASKCKFKQHK